MTAACPWPGLDAYGPEDADRFWGRTRELDALDERLRAAGVGGVIGASGSGKSSLLGAGLAARGWTPQRCELGERPVGELDAAVTRYLDEVATDGGTARRVLVLDQLERVFAEASDEERERCLEAIAGLASRGVVWAFGLRSDRYGDAAGYPEFASLVSANHVLVAAPSDADLAEMISGPARASGLELEPSTVALIVDDIDGEPGALPLLSHALAATWRHGDGRVTLDDYRAVGGVHGSIAIAGEEVWDAAGPERRAALRAVLTELVDHASPNLDIARKVPVEDLVGVAPDARAALDALVAGRLVVADGGWAQISHEAVFREWPRLRGWLEEDRAALRGLALAAQQARRWDEEGRDADGLLAGARLVAAAEAATARPSGVDDLTRDFLTASQRRVDADKAGAESRLRRERRINGILRVAVGVTALALVGLGLAAVSVSRDRERAEDARDAADARRLAALSGSVRSDQLDLAALLAVEASRRRQDASIEGALLASVVTRPELRGYVAQGVEALDATILPGTSLVAFGADQEVRIVDAEGSRVRPVSTIRLAEDDAALRIRFLDADRVVVADDGDHVAVHDVETGAPVVEASGEIERVLALEVSPDGTRVAVGDVAGAVTVYDASSMTPTLRIAAADEVGVLALAWTPDGTELLTASEAFELRRWRAADGTELAEPRTTTGETYAIVFSPDGERVAVGGDPTLAILDATTLEPVAAEFDPHGGIVYSAQWSEDGSSIMSAGEDGTVAFWDPSSGQPVDRRLQGHTASVLSATIGSDGDLMVTVSDDGRVALWSLEGSGPAAAGESDALGVTSVARGPNGDLLVGTESGTLQWLSPDGALRGDAVALGEDRVVQVVVSSTGERVAAVLSSGTARAFSLDLTPVSPELEVGERATSVALSDDGRWMAATQADGDCDPCVNVFDLDRSDPERGRQMRGSSDRSEGGVNSNGAVFSPDATTIYTISQRGDVSAFDRESGAPRWSFNLEMPARSISRSADGSRLAVGATGGKLLVVDAATGADRQVLRGHRGRVGSSAFRPDGAQLASMSLEDRSVRIWDLDTGLTVGEPIYVGLDDYASPTWDARGDRVVVPHRNGRAMIYELTVTSLRAAACELAGRDLTETEWSQYLSANERYRPTCSR